MKVGPVQQEVILWGALGLVGVALVYIVVKRVIPAIGRAGADAAKSAGQAVANIPAGVAHAAITGADNLVSEFTTPFSAWWKSLDTSAPAPINAGNLVASGATYYPTSTGTNADMGGQNFGLVDGALW
jgi:hypothetical protein